MVNFLLLQEFNLLSDNFLRDPSKEKALEIYYNLLHQRTELRNINHAGEVFPKEQGDSYLLSLKKGMNLINLLKSDDPHILNLQSIMYMMVRTYSEHIYF